MLNQETEFSLHSVPLLFARSGNSLARELELFSIAFVLHFVYNVRVFSTRQTRPACQRVKPRSPKRIYGITVWELIALPRSDSKLTGKYSFH